MNDDRETLRRIEAKLDSLAERVISLSAREEARDDSVNEQKKDIASLKAAYYKAVGILTFITFPGVATTLWLGFQLYTKKS